MGNKYRRNGYNGAAAPYHAAIDAPAPLDTDSGAPLSLFAPVQLSRWQQVKALAAELWQSRAARILAALATLAALLCMFLAAQGCTSDPVARQIIERQAEYWEADHRPEIPDATYNQLTPGQRAFFMPQSQAAARRFAHAQAKGYAKE